MNRKEYLNLRRKQELGQICYEYYKKEAKRKGFKVYDVDFFIKAFNHWISMDNRAIKIALDYFDKFFTITVVKLDNKEISYS